MSAVLTLRRMGAYLRAHGADDWAAYIEALPPDGEEALAFARSQAELGHPDPFRPRTERGRFMRKQLPGFAPNERALAVLVSLEGLREGEETGFASELVEAAMARAQRENRVMEPVESGRRDFRSESDDSGSSRE
ncbi:hypothetical protein [Solirubrobacter soli]|uniref:hypothetical protein n=1 Tax=Solirubrobacter soli TaxID=363832 RepID=UPI000421412A|nr:hypothetical protein [Solirubrobacter soli]